MIIVLKASKLFIVEGFMQEIYKLMQEKPQLRKLCCYYEVSTIFGNPELIFNCIERFFTEVVESTGFAELRYELVKRILSSQQLFLTSELEVLNSADTWVKHDIKSRSTNALELLRTVRLPLLSVHVLKSILCGGSFFSEDAESVSFIKETLDEKKTKDTASSNVSHRYCTQENFSLVVFTRDNSNKYTISRNSDGKKGYSVATLPPFVSEERCWLNTAVYCRGEVFVLGGETEDDDAVMDIEKYSSSNKKWSHAGTMSEKRFDFSTCAFMNEIVLAGGRAVQNNFENLQNFNPYLLPTLVFNPVDCQWREVAGLNEPRECCSCCVFQGKVVVSGGWINLRNLKSVESYDHASDAWTFMPDMLEDRVGHTSAAVRNKLFLIGGNCDMCEVFDSHSNLFTLLKSPAKLFDQTNTEIATASIANKIVFIGEQSIVGECFDVEKDKWVGDSCELDGDIMELSCVKVPQF